MLPALQRHPLSSPHWDACSVQGFRTEYDWAVAVISHSTYQGRFVLRRESVPQHHHIKLSNPCTEGHCIAETQSRSDIESGLFKDVNAESFALDILQGQNGNRNLPSIGPLSRTPARTS